MNINKLVISDSNIQTNVPSEAPSINNSFQRESDASKMNTAVSQIINSESIMKVFVDNNEGINHLNNVNLIF